VDVCLRRKSRAARKRNPLDIRVKVPGSGAAEDELKSGMVP
jgi:hypothetical protein